MSSVSAVFDTLCEQHRGCVPTCITANCRSRDCTAHLPQGRSLGFDCDHCACFGGVEGKKKPDYVALLMREPDAALIWFVIEMKSRPRRANDIAQQLQQGAETIESDERFRLNRPIEDFVPVLVKARGINAVDIAVLNQAKVRFKGRKYAIRIANCGVILASLRTK